MKLRLSITPTPGAPAYPIEPKGPDCLIGRDPEGQVVLDAQGVSWQHARIDVTSRGADLSDLGSTNGTYLNGQRLTARTALQPDDEIRLGQQGPVLRVVEVHGAVARAVPLRTQKEKVPPALPRRPAADNAPPSATRFLLMKVQQSFGAMQSRHHKVILAITAAVILVTVVLGGGLLYSRMAHKREMADQEAQRIAATQRAEEEAAARERNLRKELVQLLNALKETNAKEMAKMREAGADDKETAIYEKYSDAVYFVVAPLPEGLIVGTAFAVDPAGKFGTNAHVALPVQKALEAGERPRLISHGGLREYEITAAEAHPRYSGSVHSYDVGVLSARLPAGTSVPTTVQLASTDDLRKLRPGMRLLYMGFPVYQQDSSDYLDIDRVARTFEVKRSKVNARTYRGSLNRLLTFTSEKGDFSSEFVLEHDLPSMPGASGSALFGPDGKVVGLLNGMVNVKGKFDAGAPNKTGVRVDLLRELLALDR
jgi:hypothetical protein